MDKPTRMLIFFSVIALILIIVTLVMYWQKKNNQSTQRIITDKDILKLIAAQPDGLLSPHRLAEKSHLTLYQARSRLNDLYRFTILRRSANRKGRFFFSLHSPLSEKDDVSLSADPFLTVEDLMTIFRAYEGKVTPAELIMTTGLPLEVIQREMKYFTKEGIIDYIYTGDSSGWIKSRFYVLEEPYRSDHHRFLDRASSMNKAMREILTNEQLI